MTFFIRDEDVPALCRAIDRHYYAVTKPEDEDYDAIHRLQVELRSQLDTTVRVVRSVMYEGPLAAINEQVSRSMPEGTRVLGASRITIKTQVDTRPK